MRRCIGRLRRVRVVPLSTNFHLFHIFPSFHARVVGARACSFCRRGSLQHERVFEAFKRMNDFMANAEKASFLTVAEVAEIMRVSKMTVYRLLHSGELPAVRVGRSFRVNESAVNEYLESSVYDAG